MKLNEIVKRNFNGVFEENLLREICNNGILKQAESEKVILEIRREIRFIPLVVSGVVKVMRRDGKGNGIFLHYITENESSAISITHAMEGKKSEIRLKAQDPISYIKIPVKVINSWFQKYETWRAYFFKLNQQQTSYLIEKINDMAFTDLKNSVLKYLEYTRKVNKNNAIFRKHFDIALDLKVSREAISRTLKSLEKEKIVTLGRNKIILN